jgi:hypothetical protein
MTKIAKIIARLVGVFLEWGLILLILLFFAIRFSPFQTFIAQKATSYYADKLGTTITIESVDFVFFDKIYLDGVYIEDLHNEVLTSLQTLEIELGEIDYTFRTIKVKSISLTKGVVNLIKHQGDEQFNYQFIVDYFSSDDKEGKSNSPFISVDAIGLNNIDFRFEAQNHERKVHGIDYTSINLKKLNASISNFKQQNQQITATIHALSLNDHSGFILSDLSGEVTFSPDSLSIYDLKIKTPNTNLEAPYFTLRTKTYENYANFIDSVDFDVFIEKSVVSMEDVAYFAPQLWGMNQQVWLNTKVTDKVKNLRFSNLHLETGQATILKGDLRLPDFRKLEYEIFDEKLDYFQTSSSDLATFKLPNVDEKEHYIPMTTELTSLGLVKINTVRLFGALNDFTVSLDELSSDVGVLQLPYGVQFTYNEREEMYYFNRSSFSEYDVRIVSFDLGKLINQPDFGMLQGDFFLSGKGFTAETFELTDVSGKIKRFDFLNYGYQNIVVNKGTLKDNVFNGIVLVKDENLILNYDGRVEFGKRQRLDCDVTITKAHLNELNLIVGDSTSFSAIVKVDIEGFGVDDFFGTIALKELNFKKGVRSFDVEDIVLNAKRSPESDTMVIRSSVFDAEVIGRLNFTDFVQSFRNQFATILPSFVNLSQKERRVIEEDFSYNIVMKKTDDVFSVLLPGFSIASNSTIKGFYNGVNNYFDLKIKSPSIRYNDLKLERVDLLHDVKNGKIIANYSIDKFIVNDSLSFESILFDTKGTNNALNSMLKWGDTLKTKSGIVSWETILASPEDFIVRIDQGRFYMKEQLWKFSDTTYLRYAPLNIVVEDLALEHNLQYISIDGCISDNIEDKLDFFINDFELADINALFGGEFEIQGVLNGRGYVNDVFNSIGVFGELGVDDLEIDKNKLGDLNLYSNYDNVLRKFNLNGTLYYKGNQSLGFEGDYFLDKKEDALDARIVFDKTNISFVNAFLDPQVVSNVRGELTGKLAVTGDLKEPKLKGKIRLNKAGASIGILGTDYTVTGDILADEYGFMMNNLPVSDQEGNTGSVVGAIFHENFTDWNYDVNINLETDGVLRDPLQPWKPLPLTKFLVMNTSYKEGEPYYGKAYMTGTANIFGYTDNLEISVNTKTERGTWINFPMYGRSDIEDDGFIQFVNKWDTLSSIVKEKINFTGVKLNLNFDVRDNARIKIIFNENLGDEITANGSGKMSIKLDEYNQLSIDGTFRVKEGEYNFALGPVKKNFYIEEGGTVQWTGDPYNANLNLRTYYLVNANISEVVNDFIDSDRTGIKDQIYCYLELKESLEKPLITFDLAAPKAPESGKATINRIRGDKDELNRQFFSLLLFRKFQPIRGQSTVANNAALELVSNQLNSILDQVSQDYKLSVKLDSDQLTHESSYEFGVKKGFLEDRLIVTGSFGVNQVKTGQEQGAANNFIGDVSLEYKLNASGTFRVNVFNESNQYSIIQNKNLGFFTQGVGLHYQESFRNIEDFKLIQYGIDVFRPVDYRRYLGKRNNQETPIPLNLLNKNSENEKDTNSQ